MSNFTLLTSLLAGDNKSGTFKAPLFYAYKLFSNNCRGNAVDAYVDCDTFNTAKYKGIPYLDVTTVYSKETHTAYINVVNRHKDRAIATEITGIAGRITGKAEASELNAASLSEPFAFGKRDQYVPVTSTVDARNGGLSFTFPPHSFTQLKVSIDSK